MYTILSFISCAARHSIRMCTQLKMKSTVQIGGTSPSPNKSPSHSYIAINENPDAFWPGKMGEAAKKGEIMEKWKIIHCTCTHTRNMDKQEKMSEICVFI